LLEGRVVEDWPWLPGGEWCGDDAFEPRHKEDEPKRASEQARLPGLAVRATVCDCGGDVGMFTIAIGSDSEMLLWRVNFIQSRLSDWLQYKSWTFATGCGLSGSVHHIWCWCHVKLCMSKAYREYRRREM
jgi:hypothetical protein